MMSFRDYQQLEASSDFVGSSYNDNIHGSEEFNSSQSFGSNPRSERFFGNQGGSSYDVVSDNYGGFGGHNVKSSVNTSYNHSNKRSCGPSAFQNTGLRGEYEDSYYNSGNQTFKRRHSAFGNSQYYGHYNETDDYGEAWDENESQMDGWLSSSQYSQMRGEHDNEDSYCNFNRNSVRGRGYGGPRGRCRDYAEENYQTSQEEKRSYSSISPSRWYAMYDKPLPAPLFGMCGPRKCRLCDVSFNSPTVARSHYDGKAHEKKVMHFIRENISDEESRPKKVKLTSDVGTSSGNPGKPNNLSCQVCDVHCSSIVVYNSHFQGKAHARKMKSLSSELVYSSTKARSIVSTSSVAGSKGTNGGLFCKSCDLLCSSLVVYDSHVQGKAHAKKVRAISGAPTSGAINHCSSQIVSNTRNPENKENSSDYFCKECELICSSEVVYKSHMQGKIHAKKLKSLSLQAGDDASMKFSCDVCNISVTSSDILAAHLAGKIHKRKSERLKEHQEGISLKCELCEISTNNAASLEDHMKGKKHQEMLELKSLSNSWVQKGDVETLKSAVEAKVIDYNSYDFKSFGVVENEQRKDEDK